MHIGMKLIVAKSNCQHKLLVIFSVCFPQNQIVTAIKNEPWILIDSKHMSSQYTDTSI